MALQVQGPSIEATVYFRKTHCSAQVDKSIKVTSGRKVAAAFNRFLDVLRKVLSQKKELNHQNQDRLRRV